MLEETLILNFSMNIKTQKILKCNKKEMIGLSFDEFYEKNISQNIISGVVEPYNKQIVLEMLNSDQKINFFHNFSQKTNYLFNVYCPSDSIVNCSIYVIMDNIGTTNYDIDYLTGIYNRTCLMREIEKSISNGEFETCALGIIDLNNFKQINDQYGHRVGDNVLRKFATLLSKTIGNVFLGRYGGDEFIIFIKNPTMENLTELSTKIVSLELPFEQNDKKRIISCCLGLTVQNISTAKFEYLLECADKSLYEAKNAGKRSAYLDDKCIINLSPKNKRSSDKNYKKFKLLEEEINNVHLKSSLITILICLVFVGVFLAVIFKLKTSTSKANYKEATNTLSMVSGQIENNVEANIRLCFSQLDIVERLFSRDMEKDISVVDFLSQLGSRLYFRNVGVIYESGDVQFSNASYNISQEPIAKKIIIEKKPYVDNIYISTIGEVLVFAIPYEEKNTKRRDTSEVMGICGLVDVSEFNSYLATDVFDNSTIVLLTDNDGTYIGHSKNYTPKYSNIFNVFKKQLSSDDYSSIYQKFTGGVKDTIDLDLFGVDYLVYYSPFYLSNLDINVSWHIVTLVSRNLINKNTSKMITTLLIFFICMICALFIDSSFFLVTINKEKIQMLKNSYIDTVTKGINYNRFNIDADKLISTSHTYAIVLLDIVKFKYINELLGMQKSNLVLSQIYNLIFKKLASDELVSRVYADRFVMLIHNKNIDKRINYLNEEIKNAIKNNFGINIIVIYGIYSPNKKMEDINFGTVMARIALQSIKNNYLMTQIAYYNSKMYVDELSSNELEQKAESALRNHNFVVYYQAKRDISNNTWNSSEALVRWKDDNGSIIPPYKFIPLFEKNGFITSLDLYVFEVVCSDLAKDIAAGKKPLPVSINISRKHLIKNDFLDDFETILKKYDIPNNLIDFELTESIASENESILKNVINRIHQMGCSCSIDDFGTGYSSLSMLTNYKFDIIKLDRSFFYSNKEFDANDEIVVKTIIDLAHRLGKKIVAEGIEDLDMINFLKECNCDIVQGYCYAKPVPRTEFLNLTLKNN